MTLEALADEGVVATERIQEFSDKVGSTRTIYQLNTGKSQILDLNFVAHPPMEEIEPDHCYIFDTKAFRH
jgi:hypothetical protein